MSWLQAVEKTVTGLGYELVDVERAARGLLRITIDRVPGRVYASPHAGAAADGVASGAFITVEDCEVVTRQLQFVLEIEHLDYERLEVSSPGLDRPLKREADYARFAGHEVTLTLKLPFNGRKNWRGVLQRAEHDWRLVLVDGKDGVDQTLDFALEEVREARLVPLVDFKRKKTDSRAPAGSPSHAAALGGQDR